MEYGLTNKEWAEIRQIFAQKPAIKRAILFGSRAKGNFREGSDVDIALVGELTFSDLLKVMVALDDLDLLLKFDIIDYNKLTEEALRAHIDRVGKIVYENRQTVLFDD